MSMPGGNGAALAAWRKSKTPEELRAIMRKAQVRRTETMRQRQLDQAAATGLAPGRSIGITVQLRERGTYVPGSSRSFSLDGCPHQPDEIRQALLKLVGEMRRLLSHKEATKRKETIAW